MLNNVDPPRKRLTQDERRRQLLGIGLRMLVERPIQELSVDAVAAEAGISRGLLFHYFPTKGDFHDAVIGAAVRRVLRNTAPDRGATPDEALGQFVRRYFEQVDRRREFYMALVFGHGALSLGGGRVGTLRSTFARRVVELLDLPPEQHATAHGWAAYLEDRALQWSGPPLAGRRTSLDEEVAHSAAALHALLAADRAVQR
jgi:AcrR family transcriptional regulator